MLKARFKLLLEAEFLLRLKLAQQSSCENPPGLVSQSSVTSRQLFVAHPSDQPVRLEARHLTYSFGAKRTKGQRRFRIALTNACG